MQLRNATEDDAESIAALYNDYVETTIITFEEQLVSMATMCQRIADIQREGFPWLVAVVDGKVVGYAYASKWRVREAYRYSVESTVYLGKNHAGQGLGTALYTALLDRLRTTGFHLVIGGIALPNEASVALHEKMGFQKVAHFSEVGFKFGRWIDVAYWELKL